MDPQNVWSHVREVFNDSREMTFFYLSLKFLIWSENTDKRANYLRKCHCQTFEMCHRFAIICLQCSLICFFVVDKALDCKLCHVKHLSTKKTFKRKENKKNTKSKNWIKIKQWKARDKIENNFALCDNNSPCFLFVMKKETAV